MSLLYQIVFATRCRSNHHRLAVDALRHLQSPDAEAWRNLLLHFHDDYLKGAKAPDEVFKDFKNHVLHVREGEWGGAIEACEEWYRRTVRALTDKDWKQAAWCAGVMSHYYVDPIQPFHTHQTEEENVIHRAVEWSFSKSYGVFQTIIETDLGGYPAIDVPQTSTWLADMVRAGAHASNPHYEAVIDHYNFAVGAKDPPAGLDQELKDIIARLVGHAVIGLSRILDRAFAEAAVKPPIVDGSLQAVFLALEAPIQVVLSKIEDAADRKLVAAQYEEFRRTGKVRDALCDDDRDVRQLHAAEVLKTPLSSLDAKWPREIGTKAGEGAPARGAKPKKAKPAPAPKAERPAPKAERPAPKPAPRPQPAPVAAESALAPQPKPVAPPEPKPAPQAEAAPALGAGLSGESPVVDAPSIGKKTAKRLEAIGVHTIGDLLHLSPVAGAAMLNQRHISAQLVQDWQAQALLACTIPNLRSREAQALVMCDVRSAEDLRDANAATLREEIARWVESEDAKRAWGEASPPSEADIARWIESAAGYLAQARGRSAA